MKNTRLVLTVFLLPALIAPPAAAYDVREDEPDYVGEFEERKWREQDVELPPYPQDDHLVGVDVPHLSGRLEVSLDLESLAVGSDGVVRYTVVLASPSGVRNVFYEGIRCGERKFKTYAYGHTREALRPRRNTRWQSIPRRGSQSFRDDLRQTYFCVHFGYPRPRDEIVKRLKGEQTLEF